MSCNIVLYNYLLEIHYTFLLEFPRLGRTPYTLAHTVFILLYFDTTKRFYNLFKMSVLVLNRIVCLVCLVFIGSLFVPHIVRQLAALYT